MCLLTMYNSTLNLTRVGRVKIINNISDDGNDIGSDNDYDN